MGFQGERHISPPSDLVLPLQENIQNNSLEERTSVTWETLKHAHSPFSPWTNERVENGPEITGFKHFWIWTKAYIGKGGGWSM